MGTYRQQLDSLIQTGWICSVLHVTRMLLHLSEYLFLRFTVHAGLSSPLLSRILSFTNRVRNGITLQASDQTKGNYNFLPCVWTFFLSSAPRSVLPVVRMLRRLRSTHSRDLYSVLLLSKVLKKVRQIADDSAGFGEPTRQVVLCPFVGIRPIPIEKWQDSAAPARGCNPWFANGFYMLFIQLDNTYSRS